jgi:hypothetical protein
MKANPKVKFMLALATLIALAATVSFTVRADSDDVVKLKARLTGSQEVPFKYTTGTGTFTATISADGRSMNYTETWTNLSGIITSTAPLFSHIHIGQPGVAGGITVWLCGVITPVTHANDPDNDLLPCPPGVSNSISGTVEAADVITTGTGTSDQGINAGDFMGLLKIIRSGNAYVNVHTDRFQAGEIRGQISVVREDDDDR